MSTHRHRLQSACRSRCSSGGCPAAVESTARCGGPRRRRGPPVAWFPTSGRESRGCDGLRKLAAWRPLHPGPVDGIGVMRHCAAARPAAPVHGCDGRLLPVSLRACDLRLRRVPPRSTSTRSTPCSRRQARSVAACLGSGSRRTTTSSSSCFATGSQTRSARDSRAYSTL